MQLLLVGAWLVSYLVYSKRTFLGLLHWKSLHPVGYKISSIYQDYLCLVVDSPLDQNRLHFTCATISKSTSLEEKTPQRQLMSVMSPNF